MSQGGAPKIEEDIKKSDGESKKIKLSGNKMILISNDKKSLFLIIHNIQQIQLGFQMIFCHF